MNKSQHAILGILGLGPQSGYDIKKLTELSTRHFWAENYASLYPSLKKLEQVGLVTMDVQVQDGKPDRKVYTITESGQVALAHWLEAPVAAQPPRNELLLKLFLGHQAPTAVSISHLEAFQSSQQALTKTYQKLEDFLETEQAGDPNLPYWLLTLSFGRMQAEALMRWSDATLETLRNLSPRKEAHK